MKHFRVCTIFLFTIFSLNISCAALRCAASRCTARARAVALPAATPYVALAREVAARRTMNTISPRGFGGPCEDALYKIAGSIGGGVICGAIGGGIGYITLGGGTILITLPFKNETATPIIKTAAKVGAYCGGAAGAALAGPIGLVGYSTVLYCFEGIA